MARSVPRSQRQTVAAISSFDLPKSAAYHEKILERCSTLPHVSSTRTPEVRDSQK